ncbi:PREDICTED: mitochondrial uncoupling protein 4-like [Amphimedon queenslandica]|uniref:Mitochondrial uncoupling protein 4 n=1 Tax=Amphimedon queenslandica TaxID=400682 RepID=A0A1X7VV52_AMPQE|nr:PREDICTED: mitochondrial uncoupling protein 4-like [Amphimedon queenslandica]|eukprot:XP_019848686.1 PREDICTED: mitochondrial uncoupling protein 4-like [Amphimedon queenslandica]
MEDFLWKYLLTIMAAGVSETVTFPLDLTKTRLQIQGELQKTTAYKGMLRTAYEIVRGEGFFKLWKGLQPAVVRHAVYSGCRMSFYEILRDSVFKKDSTTGKFPLWKAIPTGMIAGASAQFLASPTDLVKIILQAEGKKVLEGKPIKYKGSIDVLRIILKEDGFRGLWRGWIPNCQRAAIVCLGDLTTYDTAKQSILRNTSLKDNAITHSLSSFTSGLVSAILGTPADVMKTRMMNQPYINGRGTLYSSTFDCLLKTVKAEGVPALWKGFVPTWSRMAPWSLTFWLVYEEIRVIAGVGNF